MRKTVKKFRINIKFPSKFNQMIPREKVPITDFFLVTLEF